MFSAPFSALCEAIHNRKFLEWNRASQKSALYYLTGENNESAIYYAASHNLLGNIPRRLLTEDLLLREDNHKQTALHAAHKSQSLHHCSNILSLPALTNLRAQHHCQLPKDGITILTGPLLATETNGSAPRMGSLVAILQPLKSRCPITAHVHSNRAIELLLKKELGETITLAGRHSHTAPSEFHALYHLNQPPLILWIEEEIQVLKNKQLRRAVAEANHPAL